LGARNPNNEMGRLKGGAMWWVEGKPQHHKRVSIWVRDRTRVQRGEIDSEGKVEKERKNSSLGKSQQLPNKSAVERHKRSMRT